MTANIEREAFSRRLQQALQRAGYPVCSPTQLARHFNLRFHGRPISVHAMRKWLVGEAIPTQEKIRTLAHWLAVPVEWLRFGHTDDASAVHADSVAEDDPEKHILPDWNLLDLYQRRLVREFIQILLSTKQYSPATASPGARTEDSLRPGDVIAG